jgi:hypothetical protein
MEEAPSVAFHVPRADQKQKAKERHAME